MTYGQSLFVKADELRTIYKTDENYEVVIWGTGEVALEVYNTLLNYSIPVHFFGDNSSENQSRMFQSKPVLNAQNVVSLKNPFVIIGSFAVRPIWEQLSNFDIKHIYAIIDTLKYPYQELYEDHQYLLTYLNRLERFGERNNNSLVLIEAYGNIGDVILRGGIFDFFVRRYGADSIYILVETASIAEFVRLFTKNVFVGDKLRISENSIYRRKLLLQLNEKNFKMSFILADIRLHFTRRFLNDLNFMTKDIRYHNNVPTDEYLPYIDEQFIKKEFNLPYNFNLSARGCLNDKLNLLPVVGGLPDKYIVLNFGATKDIRHYDVKKAATVVNYLNQYHYTCVMIGNGSYDDWFYTNMMEFINNRNRVISFVSKLSLLESFFVISQSDFFVGTDSGMWNASYIMEKKSVVIYGGGEYGSFKHAANYVHYAMINKCECFNCKWFCNNKAETGYARCIDGISPQMIIEQISKIIEN